MVQWQIHFVRTILCIIDSVALLRFCTICWFQSLYYDLDDGIQVSVACFFRAGTSKLHFWVSIN